MSSSQSTRKDDVQVTAKKRLAFQRKQRAMHNALMIGDQIARRNRRELAATALAGWRRRAEVGMRVKLHLASREVLMLQRCLALWWWRCQDKVHLLLSGLGIPLLLPRSHA